MTLIDAMNTLTEVVWIEITEDTPPTAMGRWQAESIVVLVQRGDYIRVVAENPEFYDYARLILNTGPIVSSGAAAYRAVNRPAWWRVEQDNNPVRPVFKSRADAARYGHPIEVTDLYLVLSDGKPIKNLGYENGYVATDSSVIARSLGQAIASNYTIKEIS